MKKLFFYSLLLILIVFCSTVLTQQVQSNSNKVNQSGMTSSSTTSYQTTTTTTPSTGIFGFGNQNVPFGSGSMDLNFVVDNQMTTNNGPTTLTGEAGRTIFYDINVTSFPIKEVLHTLYPGSESLINYLGTTNSKIFFKIISDHNNYLQFVPGFILGDNILFNASLIFSSTSSNFPQFLSSLLIPKQLTLTYPSDGIFMKDVQANQTSPNCISNDAYYYYYGYYPYTIDNHICPSVMPPLLNLYMNPSNFNADKVQFDDYYSNLFKFSNSTQTYFLDWRNVDQSFYPIGVQKVVNSRYCYTTIVYQNGTYGQYCFLDYDLLEHVQVNNNEISLSLPYGYIIGVYDASTFNYNATPLSSQQYSYSYKSDYNYFPGMASYNLKILNSVPNGTNVVVLYYPSSNVYAKNSKIILPYNSSINVVSITGVDGVFSTNSFDFSKPLDQQSTTNYFTGGSFSTNSITLGKDPGNQSLIVFYHNQTQSYTSYSNSLTSSAFVSKIEMHIPSPIMIDEGYSISTNLNSDGWADQIHIYASIDVNHDYSYSNSEKFDVILNYDSNLSNRTNNPLSVGDSGSYVITKSELSLNLSSEYQYFMNQMLNTQTDSLVNTMNSLNGKKVFDYTITSTDGLLAFFSGNNYMPTLNPSDPYYKTTISPGTGFSTFDGSFYANRTVTNSTLMYLMDFPNMNSNSIADYWITNYGSGIQAKAESGYIIENTTMVNNYAKLSFPFSYNYYFYPASSYNFSIPFYEQTSIVQNVYGITSNSTGSYVFSYDSNITNQQLVAVYTPSSFLYAINGKIVIPDNVFQINAIYQNSPYYSSGSTLLSSFNVTGNVVTIPGLTGFVPVTVGYQHYSWNGNVVYAKESATSSTLALLNLAGIFTPLTPARTPDFFITQNNVQAMNSIINGDIKPALNYIQDLINNAPNNSLFGAFNLSTNAIFSFSSTTLNDKQALLNSSLNMLIPTYIVNTNLIKVKYNISVNGILDVWTIWQPNGIFKEFGVHIHLNIDSAIPHSPPNQTTSFTKASTNLVTTSDGFILESILLATTVILPLAIYRRRKIN